MMRTTADTTRDTTRHDGIRRPTDRGSDDIEQLVAATRGGCRHAEAELFRRHHLLLLTIARRHGLDDHDAADVAQRAWLKARQALPTLRRDDRFRSWLSTIARNESVGIIRRRNRETALPQHDIEDPSTTEPAVALIHDEDLGLVRDALSRLEAGDRVLVRLLFDEGRSYRQVAAALGRPTGSIGPTRGRVLGRLRQLMGEAAAVRPAAA